jgi:mRNA interferase RelE/StbE
VHNIFLERNAEKDLDRLPSNFRPRVIAAIRQLAHNPRPSGCRKLIGGTNDWRIRVGAYRVLYEISDRESIVRINHVRHRREVYRK